MAAFAEKYALIRRDELGEDGEAQTRLRCALSLSDPFPLPPPLFFDINRGEIYPRQTRQTRLRRSKGMNLARVGETRNSPSSPPRLAALHGGIPPRPLPGQAPALQEQPRHLQRSCSQRAKKETSSLFARVSDTCGPSQPTSRRTSAAARSRPVAVSRWRNLYDGDGLPKSPVADVQ